MYRNAYQRGMLSIFFSGGAKPLESWDTQTKSGYIKRFLDQDMKTMVMEIRGTNVSTTYIICPKGKQVLGIHMPFLVMIVKNLNKYFSFEVTILDDTGVRRRFQVSNFQSTTQIQPLCTMMPIGLSEGWNQIQFNLAEFTRRAYKKEFQEVQKLKINANIRLRRIYFTDRLMSEDELPPAYKLYFPLQTKGAPKKPAEQAAPKVSSKTEMPLAPPADLIETAPVIKEEPADQIEKKPSGEQVVEKGPSAEKVGGEAPGAEATPDAEATPGADAVPGEEVAPDGEAPPGGEVPPAGEEPPGGEPGADSVPNTETTDNVEATPAEPADDAAPPAKEAAPAAEPGAEEAPAEA